MYDNPTGVEKMLRLTKFKTNEKGYDGEQMEVFVYRVLIDDKIIADFPVQSSLPMADLMAKKRLGDYILRDIKIEEITEQEDKELQIKSKVAVVDGDFK